MTTQSSEVTHFEFVVRAQCELADAFASLNGKPKLDLITNYGVHCAAHINRAVDGFICLRNLQRDHSARLLVRPALEAMFRLLAIGARPELLFRIARTEHLEDRKWALRVSSGGDANLEADLDRQWSEFKVEYQTHFSDHVLEEQKISLHDLAVEAEVGKYYDSHYRLYCQYTHASLRASTDALREFHGEDSKAMCLPSLLAIQAVCRAGGVSPQLSTLSAELKQM